MVGFFRFVHGFIDNVHRFDVKNAIYFADYYYCSDTHHGIQIPPIHHSSYANEKLSKMGFDVVTMDGDVERSTARTIVGDRCGLQGNYDPRELIEDNGKTPETVQETAKALLEELGPQRLIANLGEGLGGKESPALVQVFIDTIHSHSEAMIKDAES